jgi:hypothetical protein
MRRAIWNDYWKMRVYKTLKAMQSDLFDEGIETNIDTLALVHPSCGYSPKGEETIFYGPMFATLYVCEERMGSELLCHESVHIAMAHERYIMRFGMKYGEDCDEDEERLAYYTGRVFRGIVETLREHGHME